MRGPYGATQTRVTPQSEKILGTSQVKNSAGGFCWEVDKWQKLDRFLVLGTEGGTFYVKEKELTKNNASSVMECIKEDGGRVVRQVVRISEEGRAHKNDPALFVLAMCAGLGSPETKKEALAALPRVARIGTHLFHFMEYVEGFRGWGRALRRAVGDWYNDKDASAVAYQLAKYQGRDGWTNRDALRLSHPVPRTESHGILYNWATKGWDSIGEDPHPDRAAGLIWAMERAKKVTDAGEICCLVRNYRMSWEMLPTQFLNEPSVWVALLNVGMPLTAMIRNLGKMSSLKIFQGKEYVSFVTEALTQEKILKARVHPLAILVALTTYQSGHGVKGSLTWVPNKHILNALDEAFYVAFGTITPTNKRIMLALDVSGSMGWGEISGLPGITPRVGSAAMALVTAAVEPNYSLMGFATDFRKVPIGPEMRLEQAIQVVSNIPMGGTDCALPMRHALEKKIPVDAFVVYTDSETWEGKVHPVQALNQYRNAMGIPAKMVVVGMIFNSFTIADPNDAGMLDVVGFDTATPQLISDFIS